MLTQLAPAPCPHTPSVCAVDDGGQVWCWGTGSTGELGDGRCNFEDFYEERAARCSDSAHLSNTPTAVVGNHRCQTVTAGYGVSCCITASP